MGLKLFDSQLVFLDTAPLIYFIEGNSEYDKKLIPVFKANEEGKFQFVTSALTFTEVLIQPIKLKRNDLVEQYTETLTSYSGIEIVEMNIQVALRAAHLRVKYNLRTPDAIQVATALERSANIFLTNDRKLKTVKEIEVFTLSDL